MLHKLIKSVLFPLSIMPLIGSCSIFEPKTKVIEYDEEVKLSDGSMWFDPFLYNSVFLSNNLVQALFKAGFTQKELGLVRCVIN